MVNTILWGTDNGGLDSRLRGNDGREGRGRERNHLNWKATGRLSWKISPRCDEVGHLVTFEREAEGDLSPKCPFFLTNIAVWAAFVPFCHPSAVGLRVGIHRARKRFLSLSVAIRRISLCLAAESSENSFINMLPDGHGTGQPAVVSR